MMNTISLRGILLDDMKTTASINGGVVYHGTVEVERESGTVDQIPIALDSRRIPNLNPFDLIGQRVTVSGEVGTVTHNNAGVGHRHIVNVWVQSMYKAPDGVGDEQHVVLEGALCKAPVYRVTPLGREVCDLLIACNVGAKSNYIPVICWGRTAKRMAGAEVGDIVELVGRFQSRKYEKKLDFTDTAGEPVRVWRTAHEISARNCRVIGMQRKMRAE